MKTCLFLMFVVLFSCLSACESIKSLSDGGRLVVKASNPTIVCTTVENGETYDVKSQTTVDVKKSQVSKDH